MEKDGKTYYANVFALTDRLKVAAASLSTKEIPTSLDLFSKSETADWWNIFTIYR